MNGLRQLFRLTAYDMETQYFRFQEFFSNEKAARKSYDDLVTHYMEEGSGSCRRLDDQQTIVDDKLNICVTKHNLFSKPVTIVK